MHRFALLISILAILGCARAPLVTSSEEPPIVAQSSGPEESQIPQATPEPQQTAEPSQSSQADSESDDWRLVLVNYANPLPDGFHVALATTNQGYQVDARIVDDWEQMHLAAKADGIELLLCYGYRSLEQSTELFEKQINRQMASYGFTREQAIEAAKRVVAPPGYSEHHTGLALDIVTPSNQVLSEAFAKTDAAIWMAEHAHNFGFILRYPKEKQDITNIIFEPWHYRYVGHEAAKIIYDEGLCLEEFLEQ